MNSIMTKVQQHYDKAIEHYGEDAVLGVFLYGSQNYQCDTPNSDVDTKCILIPDLYHLAIATYDVTHLHIGEEVCECMTIMHMVKNWKKQNPNFLEIMFTHYCIINPRYLGIWQLFIDEWRERIARYNVRAGVMSICGQAIHTIKQNPKDGKKIGNAYRLLELCHNYIAGKPYSECLIPQDAALVRNFKTGVMPVLDSDSVVLLDRFEHLMKNADTCSGEDKSLKPILDNFIIELLQYRINME